MSWFNRKKQPEKKPVLDIEPAAPTIEIVAHQHATEKEVEKVKEANENLKKIFEHNHFSVKLYVAAGGSVPKAKKT